MTKKRAQQAAIAAWFSSMYAYGRKEPFAVHPGKCPTNDRATAEAALRACCWQEPELAVAGIKWPGEPGAEEWHDVK